MISLNSTHKLIEILKYIFIAFIQGVAEILPISSSGHITLASEIVNIDPSLTLSIFLHAGSLIAVIIFYRKEIWAMLKYTLLFIFKKDRSEDAIYNSKLILMLIIATIPAGLVGLLLKDIIEEVFKSNIYLGFDFLITAVVLFIISRLKYERKIKEMTALDALVVGSFQAIGVLPGISRSGITISGLKTRKFSNEDSANFAFLMFIPVSAGSFLVEVYDLINDPLSYDSSLTIPYIIGIAVAGIVTYFSLKMLLKIIKNGKLWYFSVYLVVLGISVITLSLLNIL